MIERVPTPEESEIPTREKVVASLLADKTDFSKLISYVDAKEKEVKDERGDLLLAVDIAEIYRDAGMKDLAMESFQEAIELAEKEGDLELKDRLVDEAEKLVRYN